MKTGILLISVGTSQLEALENTSICLQKQVMECYPDVMCYLAFSSQHILAKMNEKAKEPYLSVTEAFGKMVEDGVEQVVIQPTYLLNGLENDSMLEQIERYKTQFQKILIGKPLLNVKEDYIKVLYAILEEVKLEDEEALVLVGHGTSHLSNSTYQNLEYTAYTQGQRKVFVGTVEGEKSQRMTMLKLKSSGYKKVRLMPLLFVSGYHAKKDIAADSNSWKSVLEEAGYEVKPQMTGLGEIQKIREIFIEHLDNCW